MNHYPQESNSVFFLIGKSFSRYWQGLKAMFVLLLLVALLKNGYTYFSQFLTTMRLLNITVLIIVVLLAVYLWSVVIYAADAIWRGKACRLNVVCRDVYHKLSSIYVGFFTLVLIVCAIFFVGYLLSSLANLLFGHTTTVRELSALLFIGVPLAIALVLFFFVLPLLILGEKPLWRTFWDSAQLVGYKNWLRTFIPYAAIIIITVILSPATRHGHWLRVHNLTFLFDVVVLSLLAPLLINFIVLLLNDLRRQQRSVTVP